MSNMDPLTDEQVIIIAADALLDVMQAGVSSGYITLNEVHLAIGRAIEQAHGIGIKQ